MNNTNNFKVRCIDTNGWDFLTKDKIYEFKEGEALWDEDCISSTYKNYNDFVENSSYPKGMFELIEDDEEYTLTIQDIFKYPTNTKFEVQYSDGSKMCHKIRKSLSHLVDDETNEIVYFSKYLLTARYREFKIKQKEKKYIEPLKALELIENGQEVWCEYNNNLQHYNNPNTNKVKITPILHGKWFVME